MKYRRGYEPSERIEERIAVAMGGASAHVWRKPEFPFPLAGGPLVPRPPEKQTAAAMLRQTRQALGLTQEELADYLGENYSTVKKWEQAQSVMDPATWRLLQIAIRVPEARRLLVESHGQDVELVSHG